MRTTINIDDDVLELARALASARRISLGEAVSHLARRGATVRRPSAVRDGFHTFVVEAGIETFDSGAVREAMEAEEAERAPTFAKPE